MAHPKIFCNVPWTNTHIYWDGSFGVCCSENHKPYSEDQEFNLKNITVQEWCNSDPMKQIRSQILGDIPLTNCQHCYKQEQSGHESRRIKENFKSVIFTEKAFTKSYEQSHWYERFESAKDFQDQEYPIDWHVDLGNECNLSCKMCNPNASSQIASKFKKWNIAFQERPNWTNSEFAWQNFIKSIDSARLKRLHFMGGEPMLSKRLKNIIDYLISKKRTNTSISFVTNGTILDLELVEKLFKFKSFDIEISLESIYKNNDYIRQGSDVDKILNNILVLKKLQNDKFHVVLRTVPQLLSINNYDKLILWAWENKLSIQSIILNNPAILAVNVLPKELRQSFVQNYEQAKSLILENKSEINTITTGRDTSRLDIQLARECDSMINLLQAEQPKNIKMLKKDLSSWLTRWDKEFNLNAYEFYPEYKEFLDNIGYAVSN